MPPQGRHTRTNASMWRSPTAGRIARPILGRTKQCGPVRGASFEPHRIRQRDSRPAGARRQRHRVAAERRPDFGFDNIAAALNTSPLLLERYLTAAQRISGWPSATPACAAGLRSTQSAVSSARTNTSTGFRSNAWRHADPSCVPSRRRIQAPGPPGPGVEEGYAGVEGHDTPHVFVLTVDGTEVYSAEIAAPRTMRCRRRT